MMDAGDWIGAVAWTILGFIVLGFVLWAVFRILPSPWQDRVGPDKREGSAEEILRQRFARGEIDQEEYEERHRVLRKEREESTADHRANADGGSPIRPMPPGQ
jgi:putative membrane protein